MFCGDAPSIFLGKFPNVVCELICASTLSNHWRVQHWLFLLVGCRPGGAYMYMEMFGIFLLTKFFAEVGPNRFLKKTHFKRKTFLGMQHLLCA